MPPPNAVSMPGRPHRAPARGIQLARAAARHRPELERVAEGGRRIEAAVSGDGDVAAAVEADLGRIERDVGAAAVGGLARAAAPDRGERTGGPEQRPRRARARAVTAPPAGPRAGPGPSSVPRNATRSARSRASSSRRAISLCARVAAGRVAAAIEERDHLLQRGHVAGVHEARLARRGSAASACGRRPPSRRSPPRAGARRRRR